MKTIDLGKKMDDRLAVPSEAPPSADEPYYPSLYIDGGKELKDLPECGTMTIYFERGPVTTTETDGKTTVSLSLKVQQILDVEADDDDDKSDSRKARENTLDKYAEEESKGK